MRGGLGRVFVSSFGGFATFYLLLAVLPGMVRRSGSPVDAGLVTFLLTFTAVPVQLLTARLVRRVSAPVLMLAGTCLLGVPCLGFALVDSTAGIEVFTVFRGAGFGLFTVVGSLLVAQVAAPASRGRAIGLYGAIAAGTGAALPSLGLLLERDVPDTALFVLAAVVGCLPALVAMLTWRRPPAFVAPPPRSGDLPRERLRSLAPAVVSFVPAAIAFGTIYTFPLGSSSGSAAALLVAFGCAFAIARMLAGLLADSLREIHGMLLGSSVLAATGMFGLAAGDLHYPAAVAAGLGVGGLCTGSLVHMLDRSKRRGLAFGASLWNVTYDAGISLGGLAMGPVVAAAGDHCAFLVGGILLACVSIPACLWDRRVGRSDYGVLDRPDGASLDSERTLGR